MSEVRSSQREPGMGIMTMVFPSFVSSTPCLYLFEFLTNCLGVINRTHPRTINTQLLFPYSRRTYPAPLLLCHSRRLWRGWFALCFRPRPLRRRFHPTRRFRPSHPLFSKPTCRSDPSRRRNPQSPMFEASFGTNCAMGEV